jgi:hypothetical protein
MPLGSALQVAESHGSMHLSPGAALIIQEYIKSPGDIHVPIGKQRIQVQEDGHIIAEDRSVYWKNIERPAVGKCPPAKCGKCILNVIPFEARPNGYAVQRELIDSANIDLFDPNMQLNRYLQ